MLRFTNYIPTINTNIAAEAAGTVRLSIPHGEIASTTVAPNDTTAETHIIAIGSPIPKSINAIDVATQLARNIVIDPSTERVLPRTV
jgi:hypothetical protein